MYGPFILSTFTYLTSGEVEPTLSELHVILYDIEDGRRYRRFAIAVHAYNLRRTTRPHAIGYIPNDRPVQTFVERIQGSEPLTP